MTNEANNSESPKKSNKKKMLAILSAVLVLVLGTNHFTFQVGYSTVDVAVTDSTISTVVTPSAEEAVNPVAIDTTKKDTTKK